MLKVSIFLISIMVITFTGCASPEPKVYSGGVSSQGINLLWTLNRKQ